MIASGGPALATAGPAAPPNGAPKYDSSVPPPGPNDLTWDQVQALPKRGTSFGPNTSATLNNPANVSAPTATTGMSCTLDTGSVYKRTSGWEYPYGTAGGKPKTTCTVPMTSISMSTRMYKTVWWGLQQVGGPFNNQNYGVSSLTQTSVEVVCADLRNTTFRMVVTSSAVFPNGSPGGGGSAYQEALLPCGTNP